MAHKKAGGSKARQGGNVAGKRRGIKVFGDQSIKAGAIIVRQKGTKFHPGVNVGMGRDFTLFAKKTGTVVFKNKTSKKKIVQVKESASK